MKRNEKKREKERKKELKRKEKKQKRSSFEITKEKKNQFFSQANFSFDLEKPGNKMMQLIKLQFKNFQETEILQKYHIGHTYILRTQIRLKHRNNLC